MNTKSEKHIKKAILIFRLIGLAGVLITLLGIWWKSMATICRGAPIVLFMIYLDIRFNRFLKKIRMLQMQPDMMDEIDEIFIEEGKM